MKRKSAIKNRFLPSPIASFDILFGLLLAGFLAAYLTISLVEHYKFQTHGWDLGFFDQTVYQLSRGEIPYSSYVDGPPFSVRFSPILILIAPLYWIYDGEETLLGVQAILAAGAAIPFFLMARKTNGWFALTLSFACLAYIGLQRAVFMDFHPDTLLPFLTGWMLYFYRTGKLKTTLSFGGLMWLTKEWIGLLVAAIGVMFIAEKNKRIGRISLVVGSVGFILVMYFFPTVFKFEKGPKYDFGSLGQTPVMLIVNSIRQPLDLATGLLLPQEKIRTMVDSIWPFAFLPVLAPASLIPVFLQFAVRFLDTGHRQSWSMLYHYSAPLTPFLAYGAWRAYEKYKGKLIPLGLVFCSAVQLVVFHAPISSLTKTEFYFVPDWVRDNYEVMEKIPGDASLTAQDNLLAHLSSRDLAYPIKISLSDKFGVELKGEYLMVDLHAGQSEYNFFPLDREKTVKLVERLIETGEYYPEHQKGEAWLLKKLPASERLAERVSEGW